MTNEDVIKNLELLINSTAWAFFKDLVRKNDLTALHKKLMDLERDHKSDIAEIRDMRARIDLLEETLELPEKTIKNLLKEPEQKRDRDPYAQNEKEAKET